MSNNSVHCGDICGSLLGVIGLAIITFLVITGQLWMVGNETIALMQKPQHIPLLIPHAIQKATNAYNYLFPSEDYWEPAALDYRTSASHTSDHVTLTLLNNAPPINPGTSWILSVVQQSPTNWIASTGQVQLRNQQSIIPIAVVEVIAKESTSVDQILNTVVAEPVISNWLQLVHKSPRSTGSVFISLLQDQSIFPDHHQHVRHWKVASSIPMLSNIGLAHIAPAVHEHTWFVAASLDRVEKLGIQETVTHVIISKDNVIWIHHEAHRGAYFYATPLPPEFWTLRIEQFVDDPSMLYQRVENFDFVQWVNHVDGVIQQKLSSVGSLGQQPIMADSAGSSLMKRVIVTMDHTMVNHPMYPLIQKYGMDDSDLMMTFAAQCSLFPVQTSGKPWDVLQHVQSYNKLPNEQQRPAVQQPPQPKQPLPPKVEPQQKPRSGFLMPLTFPKPILPPVAAPSPVKPAIRPAALKPLQVSSHVEEALHYKAPVLTYGRCLEMAEYIGWVRWLKRGSLFSSTSDTPATHWITNPPRYFDVHQSCHADPQMAWNTILPSQLAPGSAPQLETIRTSAQQPSVVWELDKTQFRFNVATMLNRTYTLGKHCPM